MSTLKTTSITHGSNSGTANIALASDGTITFAKPLDNLPTFGVRPSSNQTGVAQKLTHAVAIAAPASYDAMKFVAATATIGGVAGETIWLTCVDDVAWHVAIPYHATSANDPGDCALIVAR